MYSLVAHRVLLASLTLLAFLCSANALSFGIHAAEEMLQAADLIANAPNLPAFSLEEPSALDAHHQGSPSDHGEGSDCCDNHHNHSSAEGPATLVIASIAAASLRFIEPFAQLPEVFLDRFIPPQNLA